MAFLGHSRGLVAYFVFLVCVTALQVTPNSPCASFCLDSSDLDISDPNSSNTHTKDIVCEDEAFNTQKQGQKFQRCLTCLQDSSFSQGSENDQQWFLYNLRYSFDSCILGYPNATSVGSNPCMTSEACGRLEDALKEGIMAPTKSLPYGYCDADNSAMLSSAYESCLECVQATGTLSYLSNFLVALEAGCEQQPIVGSLVGLNDTVFSTTTVQIVDPSASADSTATGGIHLTVVHIVIIVIGSFVVLLLVAGCTYMQIRRRQNRRARMSRSAKTASSLSFRCQTHVTPRSADFIHTGDMLAADEKTAIYIDPAAALSSNPVLSASASLANSSKYGPVKLTSITTTIPVPPPAMTSPRLSSPNDYYTTPTSTTSVRSNAPLLTAHKPYNPSEYASSPPQNSISSFSPVGVAVSSPRMGSPLSVQGRFANERLPYETNVWDERNDASRRIEGWKKGHVGSGTPVESRTLQTSFPPPPPRR